jgi:hypothetical protein
MNTEPLTCARCGGREGVLDRTSGPRLGRLCVECAWTGLPIPCHVLTPGGRVGLIERHPLIDQTAGVVRVRFGRRVESLPLALLRPLCIDAPPLPPLQRTAPPTPPEDKPPPAIAATAVVAVVNEALRARLDERNRELAAERARLNEVLRAAEAARAEALRARGNASGVIAAGANAPRAPLRPVPVETWNEPPRRCTQCDRRPLCACGSGLCADCCCGVEGTPK